jgi:trehalose 6-phosphate phosphatase
MRPILIEPHRGLLEELARSQALLAFDYDGTLAPIVDDPARAFMRRETRELLEQVTARFRVVVISGRSQPDVLRRLRGVGVIEAIGNHGIEPWYASDRHIELVRRWRRTLEPVVDALEGATLEDKNYSLALHYRACPDQARAAALITQAVEGLEGARLVSGKLVVNVVPYGAPHKGVALERACERLGCARALYVGDDLTDEDVFAYARPGQLLGVRVGADPSSAARYYLDDQAEIDDLLRCFLEAGRGLPAS